MKPKFNKDFYEFLKLTKQLLIIIKAAKPAETKEQEDSEDNYYKTDNTFYFDYPNYGGIKKFENFSGDLIDAIQGVLNEDIKKIKKMSHKIFIKKIFECCCFSFYEEFIDKKSIGL